MLDKELPELDNVLMLGPDGGKGPLLKARHDQRLCLELRWYMKAIDCVLVRRHPSLDQSLAHRTLCEGLMCIGLVECDDRSGTTVLSLARSYRRSDSLLVLLFSALETLSGELNSGKELEDALDRALEPNNWRPMEPCPATVK